MSILMPRSLLACAPICGITEKDWPTWVSVTSWMCCAQIVGKPVIAPDPAATPATAAPLFNRLRRVTPDLFGSSDMSFSRPFLKASHMGAAFHARLDVLAELLHADDEIVEGQHDALEIGNLRDFVQHARDAFVGA